MSTVGAGRRSWYNIRAIIDGAAAPEWAMAVMVWIRDTIAVPVPGLGRDGALCPFVPRALELRSLFTCAATTEQAMAIRGVIEEERGSFSTNFPLHGEADTLKALIIAFPDLPRAEWPALKAARVAVKPDFIREGFTLSEFHNDSDDRSIRNPAIRIGHAPLPCIVIRRLQIHDAIFLRSQPALYPLYLERMRLARGHG